MNEKWETHSGSSLYIDFRKVTDILLANIYIKVVLASFQLVLLMGVYILTIIIITAVIFF